jgi:hypothetical protein
LEEQAFHRNGYVLVSRAMGDAAGSDTRVWFGGIAAAVIKRLSKRAHDAEREQARRLNETYARWRPRRRETERSDWERERRVL